MIIIDANVFAKLLIAETDSIQAKNFFQYSIENNIALLAPTLFTYEVLQIATYHHHPLADALRRIKNYQAFNLTLTELTSNEWQDVETMIASGHDKSGYPSVYDSCYHVLAHARNGLFLTADKRHAAKTKKFGNIELLENWQALTDSI